MKIGLTGSHGVGKTTLLNEIHKITGIPIIKEIARTYFSKEQLYDSKGYNYIQKAILNIQLYHENKLDNFISDRTTIDNYAYYLSKNKMKEYDYKYINDCINNFNVYDIIFYIPIEFKLKSDSHRIEDKLYQKEIDSYINMIIETYDIKTYKITGDINKRVNKCVEIINNMHIHE